VIVRMTYVFGAIVLAIPQPAVPRIGPVPVSVLASAAG
jgi:hypothetical protein